jgi:hypothetical protein
MDDQEDIQQDWESGQTTIFSQTARAWPLDAVTNRMFSLGHVVLDKMDCFDAPGLEDFRSLLRRAIDLLLVDAAGRHYRFYTRPYLKHHRNLFALSVFLHAPAAPSPGKAKPIPWHADWCLFRS